MVVTIRTDTGSTFSAASIVDTIKSLSRKKKKEEKYCSYKVRKYKNQLIIILDCKNCRIGSSSITDSTCRKYIFRILDTEPRANRLVLSHLFERDYENENLDILYLLARFIRNIDIYKNSLVVKNHEIYVTRWNEWLLSILDASKSDPVGAYQDINAKIKSLVICDDETDIKYRTYKANFISMLEKMLTCIPLLADKIKGDITSPDYYRNVPFFFTLIPIFRKLL